MASNDGAQPRTPADNGGNVVTASRRGTNIDGRRLRSTYSEPIRLKTCICSRDCPARRISLNFGRQSTFLWCPSSMTKTSDTPLNARISNSCDQCSPIRHLDGEYNTSLRSGGSREVRVRLIRRPRTMWIDLHHLEKVHGSPSTQQGRQQQASL